MDPVAEPPFKTVAIEKRHKKLEIFLFAVMGRRRHQQQMAANLAKFLADLIAPRVFDLSAKIGCGHAMSFVANDEIPLARCHELLLQLFIARQNVETNNQPVTIVERIARTRCLDHIPREDVEFQIELLAQFILPLLDEAPWRDDEATLKIAPALSTPSSKGRP